MTIFARQRRTRVALAILALVATGFITSPLTVSASAPSNMTTAGYNNLRDNWDPNEPMLSPVRQRRVALRHFPVSPRHVSPLAGLSIPTAITRR